MGGRVRLWETGLEHLQRSLMEWRNMIGEGDRHMQVPLELTVPLEGATLSYQLFADATVIEASGPETQM